MPPAKRLRPLVPALIAACLVSPREAAALDPEDGLRLGVLGGLALGAAAAGLIPVTTRRRWDAEPFAFDESVKQNLSASARALSDTLLVTTLAAPLLVQASDGFDARFGRHALVYGEAVLGAVFLTNVTKYLVQRPRPFTYRADAERTVDLDAPDSYLSFFSGHSSASFAAAVAGGLLYARRTDDVAARATFWGVELFLATATAQLRVKAGKHFYSDVLLGALVGVGLGVAVPRLDPAGRGPAPTAAEWGAIGGGVLAGILAVALVDFAPTAVVALPEGLGLAPLPLEDGAGLALVGRL